MKVAICISGFLRTWEYTKNTFIQFCQDVDVDIYAHTYRQNYYEFSAKEPNVVYTDDEIRSFFDGLNVVDLVIDDIHQVRENNRPLCQRFKHLPNYNFQICESSDTQSDTIPLGERIYEQLRVIQVTADMMRQSGRRYDVVVKTRYDVLYETVPDWNSLTDNKIHFENGACGGFPHEIVVGGTPSAVVAILDRFVHLDLLFDHPQLQPPLRSGCRCDRVLPCCTFCSHTTFRHLLDYYGIEIGEYICNARVLRSKNIVHIPGLGSVELV